MEWLQKAIKQFNRITGGNVSEEATEAEFVEAMENADPMSEVLENSETLQNLESRLAALESANYVTQESLDETLNSVNTSLQEATTNIESNKTAIESAKTDLAKEINTVKTTSSKSQTHTPDPGVKEDTTKEDENEDEMKVDMKEIFQGELVPGLIN